MKEEWKKVKLGDIAEYVSERISIGNLRSEDYISTENMLAGKNGITICTTIPDAVAVPRYKEGDVLVSNIRPYFKKIWYADRVGGCSNDVIVFRAKDSEKEDSKYLYYLLSQDSFFDHMMAGANGTKMPRGNKKLIPNFESYDFPLPTQQKIASILSAYDDLIENNRKQIKLLEEAAQKLYKEWFVKLNFSGHENTKIVNGVPEGWKKTTIGEIVNIKSGFAFKSDWWQTNGCPVVKIKDIGNNTIDITAFDFVSEERTSKCKDFLLTEGDLVIAMTGATIGKIGLVPKIENLYTNQRVGKFFPKNRNNWQTPFLFCFYNSDAVQEQIIAISSSSSAQPNISGNQLESFKLVLNEEMVKLFNRIAEPIFNKILKCQTEIQNCQSARDKLLPKLMNGEFDL